MDTVAVVGLGYVGLPLALRCAEKKFKVIGLDIKQAYISSLSKKYKSENIKFITPGWEQIKDADVVIICVPTPVDGLYHPNLQPVIEAARGVGQNLRRGQLVILESTVNPGVTETVVVPVLSQESGLTAGKDFFVAHCPERINPGDKVWTLTNIPRVVGGLDTKSANLAHSFYMSILDSEVTKMATLMEAEAVKVVENSFRDINIAFVNELAQSFAKLGIDIVNVIDGAATKPFGFMPHYPGIGVGGHCIPVDPYYLIEHAKSLGFDHDFLALARRINNNMPAYTLSVLQDSLNEIGKPLKGSRVGLLGISYKPGIADLRESPSLVFEKLAKAKGAVVNKFDPYTKDINTHKNLLAVVQDSDALVIATAHPEFKNGLAAALKTAHKVKVIVDGRNCLKPVLFKQPGIIYRGIGRRITT